MELNDDVIILYGRIIDMKRHKNKIYLLCKNDTIYSLLEYDISYDVLNPILRVSDLQYVEHQLKLELAK